MRLLAVTFLGLLWVSTPLQGQTPRVRTEVDTTFITVGDRVTYSVSVEHPSTSQVVWPDSLDLQPFEILEARAAPAVPQGDAARSSLTLILTAFELGNLEIPGFSLEVVDPDGGITTLGTDPFGIQVSSVGLDEGGDIRDLKGPLAIPMGPGSVFLLVLAVILGFGLLYGTYRWAKRDRPESGMDKPVLPLRPPHEVALEALALLESSPLLERGEVKEFHIRLSDILRIYAEGRFQVPALEMTTGDLLAGMKRAGLEPSVTEAFGSFLDPCDMVKFAKHRPGKDRALAVLEQGRRLVEETLPTPSPEEGIPEEGIPEEGILEEGAPEEGAPEVATV